MPDTEIIREVTEAYEKGLDAGYAVGQLLAIIKWKNAKIETIRTSDMMTNSTRASRCFFISLLLVFI